MALGAILQVVSAMQRTVRSGIGKESAGPKQGAIASLLTWQLALRHTFLGCQVDL
jgi:hypothetical protein